MQEAAIRSLLEELCQPATMLVPAVGTGASGCWLGGSPYLPDDVAWPMYFHDDAHSQLIKKGGQIAIPMHFLAQINLSECPRPEGFPQLPASGMIYVFYDPVVAPWARESEAMNYYGEGIAVIYRDVDWTTCAERIAPQMPDLSMFGHLRIQGVETTHPWWDHSLEPQRPYFSKQPVDLLIADSYPDMELATRFDNATDNIPKVNSSEFFEYLEDRSKILSYYIEQRDAEREPKHANLSRDRVPESRHTVFGAPHRQLRWLRNAVLDARSDSADPEELIKLFGFARDASIGHQFFGYSGLGIWITRGALAGGDFSNVSGWIENNG
ncbi:DUF1963 domain-containing protein [uncultured Sulfitobacter sp.]|uniref:DUF1963 domain-containing protein n=1 Tax=uncultured Sulfitobacter sp. TaxID=191468 RepID=UPI00261F28B5|nr:DUF1963 domain-containing protein [uncultured Sulfitobacter sp.]